MAAKKPTPATDLALAAKAGALSTEIVTPDQGLAQMYRDEYKESLKGSGWMYGLSGVTYSAGAFVTTLAVTSALVGDFGALIPLVPMMCMLHGVGSAPANEVENVADRAAKRAHRNLNALFLHEQERAFSSNQKKLVELSDSHVSAGGLLDEESLAYLATIDPAHLKEASDQLVITVLQARKMLAHLREPASIEKPLTFASLDLSAKMEKHRFLLREKLTLADSGIPVEERPVLQPIDAPEPSLRSGSFAAFKRAAFLPYYFWKDTRRFKALKLPELPDVQVPALRPAKDFANALFRYEEQNGKLDLPALRGWPKTLALPKPAKI